MGEQKRFVAATGRRRKIDAAPLPEMPRERLRRLRAALGFGPLLVNQAADQFFHRHADPAGFTSEPRLVPRIDVADGDTCAHAGNSGSVDSLLTGRLASEICCQGVQVKGLWRPFPSPAVQIRPLGAKRIQRDRAPIGVEHARECHDGRKRDTTDAGPAGIRQRTSGPSGSVP